MEALRVDKELVPARLRLTDGSSLEGALFLCAFSPAHSGAQTVDELMGEPERTLPFRLASGSLVLVGKAGICAVETRGRELEGFWSRVPARLTLSGGHRLEGCILVEEGFGHRLSDRLNSPGEWLAVETGEGVAWTAKHHLITVEPEEGRPAAVS